MSLTPNPPPLPSLIPPPLPSYPSLPPTTSPPFPSNAGGPFLTVTSNAGCTLTYAPSTTCTPPLFPPPPHTHIHTHTPNTHPPTHTAQYSHSPPLPPHSILTKHLSFNTQYPPPPSILTNHRPLLPSIITINHTLNTHKTPSLSLLTTHHNTHTHTHTRTHLTVRGGPAYYFTNTDTGDHPEVTLRLPLTQLASTGTCATRYTPPPSSCSPVPSQTRHSGSWVTIDRHSHDTTLGTPPLPHNIPSPYHDTPSTTT